jgi:hypothetical protein
MGKVKKLGRPIRFFENSIYTSFTTPCKSFVISNVPKINVNLKIEDMKGLNFYVIVLQDLLQRQSRSAHCSQYSLFQYCCLPTFFFLRK